MKRLRNPTAKRLAWVAKSMPAPVLYDVIDAFGEAMPLHGLQSAIRGRRDLWIVPSTGEQLSRSNAYHNRLPFDDGVLELPVQLLTPEGALDELAAYMRTSGIPAARAGHTRYDRYLPWAAKVLNAVHKTELRQAREALRKQVARDASEERGWGTRPYAQAVMQAMIGAPDLDALDHLYHHYTSGNGKRIPSKAGGAVDRYRRAASAMTMSFRNIVDWAEHEREHGAYAVDLNDYTLAEAMQEAEEHAEWMREQERLAEAPESQVVYEWPDGWTVQELLSEAELQYEGRTLRHCVKDYEETDLLAHGGTSRIFSLRDPDNRPTATMEFLEDERRVPASGLRGFANKRPDLDQLSRLYEFRSRCMALAPTWESVPVDPSDPMTQSRHWQGRFRRRLGTDEMGFSVYETVDVFSAEVWPHEVTELDLTRELENTETEVFDREWDLAAQEYGSQVDESQLDEWATERAQEAVAEALKDYAGAGASTWHNFSSNEHEVDRPVQGLPWAVASMNDLAWAVLLENGPGYGLMLAEDGDEMRDWIEEYDEAGAGLLGKGLAAARDDPSKSLRFGTAFKAVTVPVPHLQGSMRRYEVVELHPVGRSVGNACPR